MLQAMKHRLPPPTTTAVPAIAAMPPTGWHRARRNLFAWLKLPHFTPVVVVLIATYGFCILARATYVIDQITIRLLLAMLGGQLAIGAVNELVDVDLDFHSKPAKPIPAGIISRAAARNFAGISLVVMVTLSASFGMGSLALCSLGTSAGLTYDLWLKRTLFSWLPYLLALPLIPIWVWTAVDSFMSRLLILYPLGALAVVGVHLSQALPDTVADRQAGIRSLSSMLGQSRSLALCWSSTLTAPLLASVLAKRLTDQPATVWVGSAVVTAMVVTNVLIYAASRRIGLAACFPITSVSTALMGFSWVLAAR